MLILIASCWCLPLAHALQDNSTPASFDSADAKPILQANSYQWKLMNKLLNTYDRALRPVQFINTTTNVTLNPALHSIISTNEAMESIGLVFWLRMTWKDKYLTWDPKDYDGIDKLQIPLYKIWYPDITVLNMIELKSMMTEGKNLAYVAFDGSVRVSIDQIATIHCNFKIINFPFDVQNCTLHILSWTLSADEMDIFPSYPADLGPYREHAEWDLISFSARRTLTTYGNLSSPFVDVYYDIVIQRKPTYYLTTFVLPSFIITTLAIVGIFSPFTDSGGREEKVTMGLTTLLTMSIILLLVTEQMPKSSEGVPLLGLYILFQIALSASASCISIFVMYQHLKWTKGKPVPRWFLKITLSMEKETVEQIKITASSKKREKSFNQQKSPNEAALCLAEIHALLRQMVDKQYRDDFGEDLRLSWNSAVRRLDLILMFTYILLNILSTVIIVICGFASLVQ